MLILIKKVKKLKKQNVGVHNMKRFVEDIDSGKINSLETAKNRYLNDILSDKEFLETKNIPVDEKNLHTG